LFCLFLHCLWFVGRAAETHWENALFNTSKRKRQERKRMKGENTSEGREEKKREREDREAEHLQVGKRNTNIA